MTQTTGIGIQDFSKIITSNCFYIDKTDFIREWWESKDEVTLIISLSFANVKETDFKSASYRICQLLMKQYEQYAFFRKSDLLSDSEKA